MMLTSDDTGLDDADLDEADLIWCWPWWCWPWWCWPYMILTLMMLTLYDTDLDDADLIWCWPWWCWPYMMLTLMMLTLYDTGLDDDVDLSEAGLGVLTLKLLALCFSWTPRTRSFCSGSLGSQPRCTFWWSMPWSSSSPTDCPKVSGWASALLSHFLHRAVPACRGGVFIFCQPAGLMSMKIHKPEGIRTSPRFGKLSTSPRFWKLRTSPRYWKLCTSPRFWKVSYFQKCCWASWWPNVKEDAERRSIMHPTDRNGFFSFLKVYGNFSIHLWSGLLEIDFWKS